MIGTAIVVPHPPLPLPGLAAEGGRWPVVGAHNARPVPSSAPPGVAYHVAGWRR